jgi:integrase
MPGIKSIKYLTQDELRRLLGVIDSKRDKAIFRVAYHHGLRASEVGMIRVEDADLTQGRIRIIRAKRSLGGEYPMHPSEIKAIKAWRKYRKDNNPWLFPSQRGTPITRFTLDKLMKHYGEKAGIPTDKRHFHVLKHSIATHMLDAGTDIRAVQDWIGHANINNTVVYAQISNRTRDELARKLMASPMIVGT